MYSETPKSHSISSEITFETDKKDQGAIRKSILELSQQIMYRLIKGGFKTNTVFLKIRFFDFSTTSCQKTIKHWISSSDEIYCLAAGLLKQKWNGSTPIRLIGVGMANIIKKELSTQGELFEDPFQKKRRVEEAVARIRENISGSRLTKASLLKRKRTIKR